MVSGGTALAAALLARGLALLLAAQQLAADVLLPALLEGAPLSLLPAHDLRVLLVRLVRD